MLPPGSWAAQLDFPRSLIGWFCAPVERNIKCRPVSNGQSWNWEDTGGCWVEERCSRWRRMFSSRRVGYLARTFWKKLGRKKEQIISSKEEFRCRASQKNLPRMFFNKKYHLRYTDQSWTQRKRGNRTWWVSKLWRYQNENGRPVVQEKKTLHTRIHFQVSFLGCWKLLTSEEEGRNWLWEDQGRAISVPISVNIWVTRNGWFWHDS